MKFKKIFTNARVIILLICLILAVFAIHPNPFVKGVAIRNVLPNSSAADAGIQNMNPNTPPMSREVILYIHNKPVSDVQSYYEIVSELDPNRTIQIKTNKGIYQLKTGEDASDLGFKVYDAPTTNIRQGLDLQGGTRVMLKPEEKLSDADMEVLLANMNQRLNIYGLADVIIRTAKDLVGQQYISVEIAGVSEEEVKELLSKQGKFEAKIGNNTVFIGGERDITYVCRSADCSGIDPNIGCSQMNEGWGCRFMFSITLSPKAAETQAELTKDLEVLTEDGGDYLNESLDLYLDDAEVDSLNIGADLKGRAVTEIAISGSGVGETQQEAVHNALENMKRLQTILITGSLPVKLEIAGTDSISPLLGKELLRNALLVGFLSLLAVSLIIFARYRKWQVAAPIIFIVLSEVVILLGVAALIGWNIDLAAIAAIIIAVGTGVDHQIIIADETMKGEGAIYGWNERIKRAFFIIMAAYFTTLVAMIPLWFAGAGLLKGFAVITIIGISIGVFIARPAFAKIIEILLKD